MAKATAESIWNRVKAKDDPEFAATDPDFQAKLRAVHAEAQRGGPESGIAGLEKFEAAARQGADSPDTTTDPTAPRTSDALAAQVKEERAAEATPKGSGSQTAKAQKDAAVAQTRVEADEEHSPSFPSAARPMGAESPANTSETVKAASKRTKAGSTKAASKTSTKTASKKSSKK